MPPLDKKKAELDDLRTWRNYAITSLLALIAFVFTKGNETNTITLIASLLTIVILGIGLIVLQKKITKLIREIGEL